MKKILPHEIEGWVKGKTTYQNAIKLLGKPLKSEKNANGKHVQWVDRQLGGIHWVYSHTHAQFDKDNVLVGYVVQTRRVPQFGMGFRV